jgi:hypothetical protein
MRRLTALRDCGLTSAVKKQILVCKIFMMKAPRKRHDFCDLLNYTKSKLPRHKKKTPRLRV